MFYQVVIPARGVKNPERTELCKGLFPPTTYIGFLLYRHYWHLQKILHKCSSYCFCRWFNWSSTKFLPVVRASTVPSSSLGRSWSPVLLAQPKVTCSVTIKGQRWPRDPRCCPIKFSVWQQGPSMTDLAFFFWCHFPRTTFFSSFLFFIYFLFRSSKYCLESSYKHHLAWKTCMKGASLHLLWTCRSC